MNIVCTYIYNMYKFTLHLRQSTISANGSYLRRSAKFYKTSVAKAGK